MLEKKLRKRGELLALAELNLVYCTRHGQLLTPEEVEFKKCYASRDRKYCKYIRIGYNSNLEI